MLYQYILTHITLTLHLHSGTIMLATLTSLLPTLVRRFAGRILPTGKLADFGALDTGRFASESWRSRAGRRYTDSTCHDCHCDQQEGGDGPQHCICHRLGTIRFARAAGLTLYWFMHVQQGRDAPKKKKKHFAAEARATMAKLKTDAKR